MASLSLSQPCLSVSLLLSPPPSLFEKEHRRKERGKRALSQFAKLPVAANSKGGEKITVALQLSFSDWLAGAVFMR